MIVTKAWLIKEMREAAARGKPLALTMLKDEKIHCLGCGRLITTEPWNRDPSFVFNKILDHVVPCMNKFVEG